MRDQEGQVGGGELSGPTEMALLHLDLSHRIQNYTYSSKVKAIRLKSLRHGYYRVFGLGHGYVI